MSKVLIKNWFWLLGLMLLEVLIQSYFKGREVGFANQGMAFGIEFRGLIWLVIILWLGLSVYLFGASKIISGWWFIWVGGGANIIARILNGQIWDYLSIIPGLWFNGADVMIIIGVIERMYYYLFVQKR